MSRVFKCVYLHTLITLTVRILRITKSCFLFVFFFNGPQIILNGMPNGPLNIQNVKNRFCRPVTKSKGLKKSTKTISDPSSGLFYSIISMGLKLNNFIHHTLKYLESSSIFYILQYFGIKCLQAENLTFSISRPYF